MNLKQEMISLTIELNDNNDTYLSIAFDTVANTET